MAFIWWMRKATKFLLLAEDVPTGWEEGDAIDAFLYKDSEDKVIGTTQKPMILLNEYAGLKAMAVNNVGAFFEWGPEKELLVPYRLQQGPIEEGKKYVVYLFLDEATNRLVGTTKIGSTLQATSVDLKVGEQVSFIAL